MIVADVVDREHGTVLLRVLALRPEAGEICGARGRHTEHHHRRALVVVDQGPELTTHVSKRPFRNNVFSRLRVALARMYF